MHHADAKSAVSPEPVQAAREALDAWVREVVAWHFDPATGCPFWLDYVQKLGWDPRREIRAFADLQRFPLFEDEWLRGGGREKMENAKGVLPKVKKKYWGVVSSILKEVSFEVIGATIFELLVKSLV